MRKPINLAFVIFVILVCIASVFIAGIVGIGIELTLAFFSYMFILQSESHLFSRWVKVVIAFLIVLFGLPLQYSIIVTVADVVQNSSMGR